MIDFTTPGKYKIQAKVTAVEPLGQSGKIDLITFDGIQRKIKCWRSSASKFGTALLVGAEAEAEVEVKSETRKDTGELSLEPFLVSFGGLKAGGGGRGGSYPKTPEEIHSASICGLLKSCIETFKDGFEDQAAKAIKLYFQAMSHLPGNSQGGN